MQPNAGAFLADATARLRAAGITTARLDTLILLEDATGSSRAHILAHPELQLTKTVLSALDAQLQQRETHIPLAYIRKKHFFTAANLLSMIRCWCRGRKPKQ